MLLAPPKISPASLFTLALLAFPAIGMAADAQAAPSAKVKVTAASPQAAGGAVSLKVQNRTSAALAGKVSAKAGKTAAGSAGYKVKARRTATVRLRLSAAARRKLAADARLRLSVTATVKGGRPVTSAITVTGKAQGAAPQSGSRLQVPGPADSPKPAAGSPAGGGSGPVGGGTTGGGAQTPPADNPNWVARTATSGAYDDFAFILSGGQINVTQRPLAYLQCSENGGSYRTYGSWELFTPTGPWTLGAQSQDATATVSLVNLLAGSSPHTAHYQLRTTRSGGSITGQLYMSAAWSNYDYYNNKIVFVNCFGTTSFEAVQG